MERRDFTQSFETQQLVKYLADESHDPIFTYAELSKVAGVDIQDKRSPLRSACDIVQREHHIVFHNVRGVGYQRADDKAIVQGSTKGVSRIRNIARRTLKALGCVRKFSELPDALKVQHNVQASAYGMIYHATTNSAHRKIESKVAEANKQLPLAETLAALTNK